MRALLIFLLTTLAAGAQPYRPNSATTNNQESLAAYILSQSGGGGSATNINFLSGTNTVYRKQGGSNTFDVNALSLTGDASFSGALTYIGQTVTMTNGIGNTFDLMIGNRHNGGSLADININPSGLTFNSILFSTAGAIQTPGLGDFQSSVSASLFNGSGAGLTNLALAGLPLGVLTNSFDGYSADPTGIIDCSASLSNALRQGYVLMQPHATTPTTTYLLTKTVFTTNDCGLIIPPGVTLKFTGTGAAIDSFAGSNQFVLTGGGTMRGASNVVFNQITPVGANNYALHLWGQKNSMVDNITFRDFGSNSVAVDSSDDLFGQTNCITFRACFFTNNYGGLSMGNPTRNEWWSIDHCRFYNNYLGLVGSDADITVDGCLWDWNYNNIVWTGQSVSGSAYRTHALFSGGDNAHGLNTALLLNNCGTGPQFRSMAIGASANLLIGTNVAGVVIQDCFLSTPIFTIAGSAATTTGASNYIGGNFVAGTTAATWNGVKTDWIFGPNVLISSGGGGADAFAPSTFVLPNTNIVVRGSILASNGYAAPIQTTVKNLSNTNWTPDASDVFGYINWGNTNLHMNVPTGSAAGVTQPFTRFFHATNAFSMTFDSAFDLHGVTNGQTLGASNGWHCLQVYPNGTTSSAQSIVLFYSQPGS